MRSQKAAASSRAENSRFLKRALRPTAVSKKTSTGGGGMSGLEAESGRGFAREPGAADGVLVEAQGAAPGLEFGRRGGRRRRRLRGGGQREQGSGPGGSPLPAAETRAWTGFLHASNRCWVSLNRRPMAPISWRQRCRCRQRDGCRYLP